MGLIDKLINGAIGPKIGPRKVIVLVLLDDEGRIQDVILKRSCGDPAADLRALMEIRQMKFPRGNLGSGSKKARRWHELVYTIYR